MKKILFLALLAFGLTAKAQITLEHTYTSASLISGGNQLMFIKFEVSGERYVRVNRTGKTIDLYDLNHSLTKTISLNNLPVDWYGRIEDILYISENLFNTDSKIEFMNIHEYTDTAGNSQFVTNIYNEDGNLLFCDTGAVAMIRVNFEQQQMPIYNTSNGTKMILSCNNGNGQVFSLPGTLSESIQEANNLLLAQSSISNAYPNPTNNSTQIDYKLPDGINEGEIVFYDLQGNEVKRFKVDRTFTTLLISTSDIKAGTYYYQLQTTEQNSEGKKLIVIK